MRGSFPIVLPVIVCLGAAPALALDSYETPDREALRKQWHRCVRQAFSGQPASVEKRAAERAALAACKASEDAYVAAELAARQTEGTAKDTAKRKEGLTTRARAFMASMAASVVDPVASWFGGLLR